ncbi:MAG: hypothetical protein H6625_02545 [Bdellovibrionaceae bacterium]|nr:hypothetical protein [Pseudobdellovibrionaceae bacterium]
MINFKRFLLIFPILLLTFSFYDHVSGKSNNSSGGSKIETSKNRNQRNILDSNSDFFANRFAQLINRIQEPSDIYSAFQLSERDKELIKKEILGKKGFVKPRVKLLKSEVAELFYINKDSDKKNNKKVTVSFKHIHKGVVLVQGKVVKLEKHKTFVNYRSEIQAILKKSKFAWFYLQLLPTAAADSRPVSKSKSESMSLFDWASVKIAALFSNLQKNMEPDIADEIISAYEEDLSFYVWKTQAEAKYDNNLKQVKYNPDSLGSKLSSYSPNKFSCKNNKLERLERILIEDGKVLEKAGFDILQALPEGKGYTFQKSPGRVKMTMDSNFKVSHSSPYMLEVGESFLNQIEIYGTFPFVAQKCCAKKGCYEKVSRVFQGNLNKVIEIQKAAETVN